MAKYKAAIIDYLQTYAEEQYGNDPSGIATHLLIDQEQQHFMLFRIGWSGGKQLFYTPIYIALQGEKVWIQLNNTEEAVADELMRRGIPKGAIVLGFHPEELRKFTDFAVA